VNPRHASLHGLTCYPSLSALPEKVDAAFLAVPSTSGPDLVEEAGRCGIPALANQASVRLGPVTPDEARAMLDETAAGKLLRGARGRAACDLDAAAAAIAAFSRFGAARVDTLASLEINPLIVGPRGAKGVDVLFEPFGAPASETYP
jgi:hypothetical protein